MFNSYKSICRTALPIFGSMLVTHTIGLTDTAFLGRVSEAALGATAMAGIFYLALFMIGNGFSTGAQILIARRHGEGRLHEIGLIFAAGMLFQILLAGGLCLFAWTAGPMILKAVIKDQEVLELSISYLTWRSLGLFAIFGGLIYRAFFVGITRTRVLTANAVVMLLANIFLNYMLIFGKCGFPALGVAGAAIASVVAEVVAFVFYMIYVKYRVDARLYALKILQRFDIKILKSVLNVSVYLMLQSFLSIGVWFYFFVEVESLGRETLAAIQLIRQAAVVPFLVLQSFAITGSTFVSNIIGAGHIKQAMIPVWRCSVLALLWMLPLLAVFILAPVFVFGIFTEYDVIINACTPAAGVMVIVLLIQAPAFVCFYAVSGTGNTQMALAIEAVVLAIYIISVYYFVTIKQGSPAVCWITEVVYQVFLLLFCLCYLYSGRWKHRKI